MVDASLSLACQLGIRVVGDPSRTGKLGEGPPSPVAVVRRASCKGLFTWGASPCPTPGLQTWATSGHPWRER